MLELPDPCLPLPTHDRKVRVGIRNGQGIGSAAPAELDTKVVWAKQHFLWYRLTC